jgi:hypothetical protein
MAIYSQDYVPYFYIIQDVRNGMYYAGAKWGKNSNPKTFLKENGYKTSSKVINKIIQENGIQSFVIVKIKVFDTPENAQDYETKFLMKVDARNNNRFYNTHNNDGVMNREKLSETMNILYGVDHHFKAQPIKQKMKETWLEKYGVDNPRKSKEIQEKSRNTCLEKYGDENYNNREQAKETCMEKYSVSNISQREDVKEAKLKKRKERLARPVVSSIQKYKELDRIMTSIFN